MLLRKPWKGRCSMKRSTCNGATVRVKEALMKLTWMEIFLLPPKVEDRNSYMGYTTKEVSTNQNNVTMNLAPGWKATEWGRQLVNYQEKRLKPCLIMCSNSAIQTLQPIKDANLQMLLQVNSWCEINSSAAGIGGGVKGLWCVAQNQSMEIIMLSM